jgi:predicted RNA binding protein YcfA (HicA-like mRNA interferase family)
MGKLDKLIQQFLDNPPEVRFEDVRYLLEAFGFVEIRSKGSHHSFRNEIGQKVVIPKKGGQKVKGVYVKLIVDLLALAAPTEIIAPAIDDESQDTAADDE